MNPRHGPSVLAAATLALAAAHALAAEGDAAPPAKPSPMAMFQDPAAPATWDLSSIYPDGAVFEAGRQKLLRSIPSLKRLRGTLADSPAALLRALDAISDARRDQVRLQAYASLVADEDLRIQANEARRQAADAAADQLDQATAWLMPEIAAMGAAKVDAAIAAEPGLAKHAYALHTSLRQAAHMRPAAGAPPAAGGDPLQSGIDAYDKLVNAELAWPTITWHGQPRRLDPQAYVYLRGDPDPKVRDQVFKAFWPVFQARERTFGQLYLSHLKDVAADARARHYDSVLDMQLDDDGTPAAVYRTMVAEANAGLPVLHRYLALRARLASIAHPKYPDAFVVLARSSRTWSLAEAEAMTLDAMRPLGKDYVDSLKRHFGERWIHAVPQPGKRAGAYMNASAYDAHPFVLMSFIGDDDSVSTLANMSGHLMHSVLANATQPFETANYGLVAANIPATCAEMLLDDELARRARTKEEKIHAIGRQLELLRTTFFRQAQFAEFELRAHEAIEKGEPLTAADLTRLYLDLLRRHHGDREGVMKIEDLYGIEWAYLPHFYSDYSVFPYATSISAAAAFAEGIAQGDVAVRERYLAMLKAGGSDDAYAVVKAAGVDLATPAPYRAVVARMSRLLDELEKLTHAK